MDIDTYIELAARCVSGLLTHAERQEFLDNMLTQQKTADILARAVPPEKEEGLTWDVANLSTITMIGLKRLRSLGKQIVDLNMRKVPGDIVETGIWRGGACIFAALILKHLGGDLNRRVIGCDSFCGLPPPKEDLYPVDKGDTHHTFGELRVSLEKVEENIRAYKVEVTCVKGWFSDTMDHVQTLCPSVALLRLDGDMYESTIVVLNALEKNVPPGGYVVIDDWCIHNARKATQDYRAEHNIQAPIVTIDRCAVFWQKA